MSILNSYSGHIAKNGHTTTAVLQQHWNVVVSNGKVSPLNSLIVTRNK
jgi:hypothetical protein